LFTDRETAERAGLPHTQVAGDIVMVPAQVAERAMRPAVTVLPATAFAGAAPTAPDTRALGAGPSRAGAKPNVVITELRDPPVTVIETNGRRVVAPQY
jgi:methenyltetrahydromethanopterin cyclohydrolase